MKKEKALPIVIFLISIVLFFAFGTYHLGKFATADEHYWVYERIPQYFKAIQDGKFKKTRINDKPGVSLALVSGIGMLWEKNPASHFEKSEKIDNYDSENSEHFYWHFRIPIIIFNLFIAIYIFWVIGKILKNKLLSALAASFIILSPVILGISQIINPDALLWSTFAAAIFSFFALVKTKEKKFIFLTGLFTGLALLSKYTANILFVFYFLFILIEYLINFQKPEFIQPKEIANYFKKNISWLGLIFLIACVVLGFFMPAAVRNPKIMYLQTIGSEGIKQIAMPFILAVALFFMDALFLKATIISRIGIFFGKLKKFFVPIFYGCLVILFFVVLTNWIFNLNLFDTALVSVDARSSDAFIDETSIGGKILLETFPLVFSLTPIILVLMIFYWINKIFEKKEDAENDEFSSLGLSISLFLVIFLVGGIISGVLWTPRYIVILYPLAGLLAVLAMQKIFKKNKCNFTYQTVIVFIFLVLNFLTLWNIKPFYFNYASFLLPKTSIASDAWGFGGYEAAEYINSLPDAKNLTVWADYYGVCEFFIGNCTTDYKFDKKVDYYVLTRRGKIRYTGRYLPSEKFVRENNELRDINFYHSQKNTAWELNIDNRSGNYIKVVKVVE